MFVRHEDGKVAEIFHDNVVDLDLIEVASEWEPYVTLDYVITSEGVRPPSTTYFQNQLEAALAAYRWEKQVGGLLYRDHIFHTDAESRSTLAATVQYYDRIKQVVDGVPVHDPNHKLLWKSMTGHVELHAVELGALSDMMFNFVRHVFAREGVIAYMLAQVENPVEKLALYNAVVHVGWNLSVVNTLDPTFNPDDEVDPDDTLETNVPDNTEEASDPVISPPTQQAPTENDASARSSTTEDDVVVDEETTPDEPAASEEAAPAEEEPKTQTKSK